MFHLNVSFPMRASLFIAVSLLLMTTSIIASGAPPIARNLNSRKRTSQELIEEPTRIRRELIEEPTWIRREKVSRNFTPHHKVRCASPDITVDLTNDGNGPALSPNGCAARCRKFKPLDCSLMHFNLTTEECFTCNESAGIDAPLMDDDRIQSYFVYPDDIDLCHKTCYFNMSCSLTKSKLDFVCACPGGSAGDYCERRVFELTLTRKLGLTAVGILTGILICFAGALYSLASSRKKSRSSLEQIKNQGVLSYLWGEARWFDSTSTAAVFEFENNIEDGKTWLVDLDEHRFEVTQAFDSYLIHVIILPIDKGDIVITGTVEVSTRSIWWEAQEETWYKKNKLDDDEDKLYKERSQPRRTVTRSEGSCVEGSVRMSEPGARSHSLAIAIRYPKYFLSQDSIAILETPGCPCPFRQKLKQDLEDAFPEDKGNVIEARPCEILPSTKEYPNHKFIVVTFHAQFRQTLKGLYKNLKVQIKYMNGNLGSLKEAVEVSAILITTPHIKRSVIATAFEIQQDTSPAGIARSDPGFAGGARSDPGSAGARSDPGYSSASSANLRASTSVEGRPNPSKPPRTVDQSSTANTVERYHAQRARAEHEAAVARGAVGRRQTECVVYY